MRRFIISRRLWWTFAWGAAVALGLGLHSEMDCRDRLANLPSLVDEHGNTASLETAMAGMDSYEEAKRLRKFGFVSFGVGAVFSICAAATKREESDAS
jgi:hypothetical protein